MDTFAEQYTDPVALTMAAPEFAPENDDAPIGTPDLSPVHDTGPDDDVSPVRTFSTGDSVPPVRAALESGSDLDAAMVVRARTLARTLDLPENLVREAPERATLEAQAKTLEQSPRLAAWAAKDRGHAALVRDDANLATVTGEIAKKRDQYDAIEMERRVREYGGIGQYNVGTLEKTGRAIIEGKDSVLDSIAGGFFAGAEASGIAPEHIKRQRQLFNAERARRTAPVRADGAMEQYWLDFIRNSPQFASQVVMGAGTGGTGSMLFMGSQIAGGKYLELTDEGVTPERALAASLMDAGLQAPLEQIGLNKFMGIFKTSGFGNLIKAVGVSAATEFVTEALQKYPEEATKIWGEAVVKGRTPEESISYFFDNFGQTTKDALYEGALAIPYSLLGVGHLRHSYKAEQRGREFAAGHNDIAVKLDDTNLKKLSPSHLQEVLEFSGMDESVVLPAKDVLTLRQNGLDLLPVLEVTEEQAQQAAAMGHGLETPVAALHAHLDAGQFKAVSEIMRSSHDAPNIRELTENLARFQGDHEQAMAALQEMRAEEAAYSRARDTLAAQTLAAIEQLPGLKAQTVALAGSPAAYVNAWMQLLERGVRRFARPGLDRVELLNRLAVQSLRGEKAAARANTTDTVSPMGAAPVASVSAHTPSAATWSESVSPQVDDGMNLRPGSAFQDGPAALDYDPWTDMSMPEYQLPPVVWDAETAAMPRDPHMAAYDQAFADEWRAAPLRDRLPWLGQVYGRIDGKSLRNWPGAYKSIGDNHGRGIFRRRGKGGIAVDELADELVREGIFRPGMGADDLVEMLRRPKEQFDTLFQDAAGQKTARVAVINQELIPSHIKKIGQLRDWLLERYSELSLSIDESGRIVEVRRPAQAHVRDDGAVVKLGKKGITGGLKRSRSENHRMVFAALKKTLMHAVVDHSVINDGQAKHAGTHGQTIYRSAVRIGDDYYGVTFRVDVHRESLDLTYKDHSLAKIDTAPLSAQESAAADKTTPSHVSDHQPGTPALSTRKGAIHGISLDILKGEVKPSRVENGVLYQSANVQKTARVVEIDPSIIPVDLKDTAALHTWIMERFQGKTLTIDDDGSIVGFSSPGLKASAKKRGKEQRQTYAGLDKLLESAVYDGFVQADARHPELEGQRVYHAAMRIDDTLYAVRFKVDVPRSEPAKGYYKDHKTTKIEMAPSTETGIPASEDAQKTAPDPFPTLPHGDAIGSAWGAEMEMAPAPYVGPAEDSAASPLVGTEPSDSVTGVIATPAPYTELSSETGSRTPLVATESSGPVTGAIYEINIDVLKGEVKPSRVENGVLFQSAKEVRLADEALRQDAETWGKSVDAFPNIDPLKTVTMLNQTPLVLQMFGAQNRPVTTSYNVLKKVLEDKHRLSAEVLKQVPAALADPVMVFDSATQGGDLVVMLELKDAQGATVNVPIALEQRVGRGDYFVNVATSVFGRKDKVGKPDNKWFVKQMQDGRLLYRNNKKSRNWARTAKLQLPGVSSLNHGKNRLYTEADLVKLRQANPTLYQSSAAPRGMLRIFDDNYVISLMQRADLSTLPHETAHVFFEEFQRLIDSGLADDRAKTDWGTLQSWLAPYDDAAVLRDYYNRYLAGHPRFGGKAFDELTADERDAARGIARHEHFASGFELYLAEGKAPSAELADVFSRFRRWLLRIYERAVQMGVELDDDVRGVFDRMLAVEEEIDAVAAANELADLTRAQLDALQVTGPEREYAATLMEAARNKAAERLRLDREKERKAQIAQWAREAREDLENSPVYQARAALGMDAPGRRQPRSGAGMDAEPEFTSGGVSPATGRPAQDVWAAVIQTVALDLDMVQNEYGSKMVADLRRTAGHTALAEGGLDPQIMAAQFGFASGADMLAQVTSAPALRTRVREMVQARESRSAATFDATTYLLETREAAEQIELVGGYLARNVGKEAVQQQAFARVAEGTLERMPMGKARQNGNFLMAMRRALHEERAAVSRGDFAAALEANHRARLNLELVRRSKDIAERHRVTANQIKRFVAMAQGDPSARFAVMDVGKRHALCDVVEPLADGRDPGTIRGWIAAREADGYPLFVDDAVLYGPGKPWGNMTVGEFQNLAETVSQIVTVERNQRHLLTEARQKALDEAASELADAIHANHARKPQKTVEDDPALLKGLSSVHAVHTKMEVLCLRLDGGKTLGKAWEYIYRPINEAEDRQGLRFREVRDRLKSPELFGRYKKGELARDWFTKKTFIPEVGESFTREQIVAVALNTGNDANQSRLRNGHNWTDEQIGAITGRLTKGDWDFVQAMWDYIGSFRDEAFAIHEEITGMRPEAVEARPVQTAYGVYKGGYYPIKYNAEKSFTAFAQEQKGLDRELFGGRNHGAAVTKKGHLKQRGEYGLGSPLLLELSVATDHIFNVVHDICFRKAVLDVAKIINHKTVREAVESALGRHAYREMMPWLQDVAGERQEPMHYIHRAMRWARAASSIMQMGYKATTVITQPFGFTQSVEVLGRHYAGRGLKIVYGNPLTDIRINN